MSIDLIASQCRLFAAVLTAFLALCEAAAAPLPPSEAALKERIKLMSSGGQGDYLREVRAALAEHRFAEAERQASQAIDGPPGFANQQLQAYVLSLAYLHRAEARRGLDAQDEKVWSDLRQAALLGNLKAIRQLVEAWVGSAQNNDPSTLRSPGGIEMEDVLAAGLDLDEVVALKAAASGLGRYTPRERDLFALRYELRARDSSFVSHVRSFARSPDAQALMRTHFLVGTELPASAGVPGRDVLATFFAESNLRSTMAIGLGFALPSKRPEHELSLRELMEVNSWLGDMSGLASAYHFVSEEPDISARHRVVDAKRFVTLVGAGDVVNVRCGGIAHTAVVLRVDTAKDEIAFTDPLYEYWQPTNNNCITTFSLVHFRYGYYASVLRLSEVLAMLDSIQSARTFTTPVFIDESGPDDASLSAKAAGPSACRASAKGRGMLGQRRSDVTKADLFEFFHFEMTTARPRGSTTITTYMVEALEFRGDVLLRLQTQNDCVISASLFLRRSFLDDGRRRPFAFDLMKSFLSAVYDDAETRSLQAEMTRPVDADLKSKGTLTTVFSGEAETAMYRAAGRFAQFGNVTAETGARWFRVDAR